jgi:hypothetical protein
MAARTIRLPHFFYRVNTDNTVDSICACCYLTVATAPSEGALHVFELAHRCEDSVLLQFGPIRLV